jgi:Zn-dependent membrane protease YugP
VEIVEHDEALGDHYDPAGKRLVRKRLVLSQDNFHGTSAAALAVYFCEAFQGIDARLTAS